MIIYLDVSCLNRPFDDQLQTRIRLESEALTIIFDRMDKKFHRQVSSEMAAIEIAAMSDLDRRRRVRALLPPGRDIMPLNEAIFDRAKQLERRGFKAADAVHVAAAEALRADVLLSCDDRMCAAARRNAPALRVRVANPLTWLQENHDDQNP